MRPLHKLPPDAQEAVKWQAEHAYARPLGLSKEQFEDELAIVRYPVKRRWRRFRSWTIGILAVAGLIYINQMLRPIISDQIMGPVLIVLFLAGVYAFIYRCGLEEREEETEREGRTAELKGRSSREISLSDTETLAKMLNTALKPPSRGGDGTPSCLRD